jgi:hypothetical protein
VQRQERAAATAKTTPVDAHDRLAAMISHEQDDLLATLQLVQCDPALEDRLWTQLVDLLIESAFVDLRRDLLAGALDRDAYLTELTRLAEQCRNAGLLPLKCE